eukprot:6597369-Ditylum_brightwellii.AAC.1
MKELWRGTLVVVDVTDAILACCTGKDGQMGMLALYQVDGDVGISRFADGTDDGLGVIIKGDHTGMVQKK